ncbi:MAG: CHRD domain-containing protein [Anaeromyxobacter sp.]
MSRRPLQLLTLALALGAPASALSQGIFSPQTFSARLNGFKEVPTLSTQGFGTFSADITVGDAGPTIAWTLTFSGLSAPASAAHIHLGQPGVAGGIAVNLCGAGSAPACPAEGSVTGTIDATSVVGPAEQGIAPGELQELLVAMVVGATYVNVHTATFPTGEIRGQIGPDLLGN